MAVSGGVEDIADSLTFSERMIGDFLLVGVTRVCQGNKELTTRVGKEIVGDVALHVWIIPNLAGLPLSMDLCNQVVEVSIGLVKHLPEGLTVVGVIASSIILLSSIVGEGDTTRGKSEYLSLLQTCLVVRMAIKETGVVMIVNKDAERVDVLKVGLFLIVAISDAVHRLAIAEDVADCVEHRVVEKTSERTLVRTNVCGIAIEALTHLEYAGGLTVFSPEIFRHFRDSVNADAIKVIRVNDALNPVLEVLTHIAIALVEVRETSKSAVLD